MGTHASAITLIRHIVERQDTIDVDDGVLGTVTIQMKLLRSTSEIHPAFKLDIWNGELEDGS